MRGATVTGSETATPSLLLVGYGNTSRRDDGVAAFILQSLLARLGLDVDRIADDAEVDVSAGLKVLFLHQLAPELAQLIAEYGTVVFVDAHVDSAGWEPFSWRSVEPSMDAGMVGHHLKPGMLLALAESLYGNRPETFLLSVQGHDFDFGEELSDETLPLAEQAIDCLFDLARARGLV